MVPCSWQHSGPIALASDSDSRFPAACSATGLRFLSHPAPAGELSLPHGRPTGPEPGPHRGCHVAHEQAAAGQGASFTPGTAVCVPTDDYASAGACRFPTASPYSPAETSHRRGSPSRSLNGGSLAFAHPDLLLACGTQVERAPLGFFPELRTPQSPATHAEAETGHHTLTRVLHPRHQPNLPGASHFTHAPSCRT